MSGPAKTSLPEKASTPPETCALDPGGTAEYWRWCPRCSHELLNHKCKLVCPRCNYFMSCSDFD